MNTENEKRLDDLFKKKLGDPVDEPRYEEGDWDALEQMLGKPKRSGILGLWPIISAVAAILLLFFGWWAFGPKNDGKPTKEQLQAAAQHKTNDSVTNRQAAANPNIKDTIMNKQAIANSKAADTVTGHKAIQQALAPVQKALYNVAYAVKNNDRKALFGVLPGKKDTSFESVKPGARMNAELVAMNSAPVFITGSISDQSVKQLTLPIPAYNVAVNKNNIKIKGKPAFRPQYALTILAAPDLNGVGSFQQSKVGTNIGMTFAVGLTRKLTITTGALYSVKPYITNFSNYHTDYQFKVDPLNVTADCRMLDIPLNVGYQVYHKHQDKISLGTGLSSYLMLHESYKYNYEYAGSGPLNYNVANPGKYFFGVVNLNATYERQINSKVGISIQPYMKLPISNVGYSQVKLQTTGVAIGLSWNLNSLTKP